LADAANSIPGQREHDERVVFGDAGGDAVGKFRRHEQHEDGGDEEEAFEKQRERILDKRAVERRAEHAANAVAAQADEQKSAQRRNRRVGRELLALGGHPEIRQHQHDAEGDYADFKRDGGGVHQLRVEDCGF
jgi:hypothetical protein